MYLFSLFACFDSKVFAQDTDNLCGPEDLFLKTQV
jgi:hypothetical protein